MRRMKKERIIRCGNYLRFPMPLPNPEGNRLFYSAPVSGGESVEFSVQSASNGSNAYFTVIVYPDSFYHDERADFARSQKAVTSDLVEKVVAPYLWGVLTRRRGAYFAQPMPEIVRRRSLKPVF